MFKRLACTLVVAVGALVSLHVIVAAQQRPTPQNRAQAPIRLTAATFTPTRGELPAISSSLRVAGYPAGGRGYYLVQFEGPILEAWKADVTAIGAELLDYVPDFAFKVRMNPGQANRVEKLDTVVWVGIFHPGYKLGPALMRNGTRPYTVRIERGADTTAAAAEIAATGAQVLQRNDSLLTVGADPTQLDAIARVLDVASVENFLPRTKHNEYGGGVILGANLASARGYDGSTQTIAIADTGLGNGTVGDAHVDIPASRISAIFNWPGSPNACFTSIVNDGAVDVDSGHGTHTATSALGSGGPGGEGRGTAAAAHLVFQAVENWATPSLLCQLIYGLTNGYYLVGIPGDIRQLFQQGYDAGARIHSDSWGAETASAYTTDSANADDFVWKHRDMTITFSAGNAGTDANADGVIDDGSIGSPATAKNVISVGASENDRQGHWNCDVGLTETNCAPQGGQNSIFTYGATWPADYPANPIKDDPSAGNDGQMAAFSSRGPTDDGRIKPDVVAPGTWVLSGYSDQFQQQFDASPNPQNGVFQYDGWGYPLNRYYKYMGGTSMSNPLVAGAAAVVSDFYAKTADHSASAALVKATLVNSAVDLQDENNDGISDNAYPIPNNHEGWGRVDLAGATSGNHQFIDDTGGLATGSSAAYMFAIGAAGSPLKITLAWSDFPSTSSAAKNLVNDLDLKVTAPDGTTTYLGNVFAGGWSQAGGNPDRTNNLENVYVASAEAGMWVVEVRGFNVPYGPQPFALVASGTLSGPGSTLPPVTVAATTPVATEAGPIAGTFTVARAGDTTAPLSVHYGVAGTASAGTDYAALSGVATIPAGSADVTITVSPIDDALVEPDETIVLTLIGDVTYSVGSPAAATVTLTSDDQAPDLVVSALTVPATAGAGAAIVVSDTTKNQGGGGAASSTTRFYLSTNLTLDGSDPLLGGRSVPSLAANTSDAANTTVVIPASTATGSYYVLAQADAEGAVTETLETNNVKFSSTVKVGPDLVVSSLTVPSVTGAGQSIVVTDTTNNQGAGRATDSTTRFYLSLNFSLDASDISLGSRLVPPLDSGTTSTASTPLTIPNGTAIGTYYIIATADANGAVGETVETNNVKFSLAIKVGPDLAVTTTTVPLTAVAGTSITVGDTTKNQGGDGAASSTTGFYLSTNLTLDASDALLGGRTVGPLGPGLIDSGSLSVTIPNGTPAGTYYIITAADANNTVAEIVESNNTYIRSIRINGSSTLPQVTIAATTPVATEAGIAGTFTVTRAGDTTAPLSVHYGVAGTASAGTDYAALSGLATIPAGSADVTITVSPLDDALVEPNETIVLTLIGDITYSVGSPAAATVTLTSDDQAPDLVVSALTVPATAGAGAAIVVSDTTKNQGGGGAASSTTRFYLSTNLTLDGSDPLLGGRSVPPLAANTSDAANTTVVIPASTATGSYYVLAQADAEGAVTETLETNNVKFSSTVKVGPDLTVTATTVPLTAGAGTSITVGDTTKNQGGGGAASSTTGFYLSTNLTLDASDALLGRRTIGPLGPGLIDSGSLSVAIPNGTPAGTYYILAAADADNTIAETVESNNTYIRSIRINAAP